MMTNAHPWKRTTALFLTSQALSLFGSSLVQYALMWHVTLATRSGWAMTVYILCGFVPAFVMAPFGGVWADRMDRKRLIMLSDGIIAVATLALALVFLAGEDALWLVMLTAAVRSLGTAVHGPAVGAILPQFVPEAQLTRVNGISTSIQSATMLVSPLLAGVLMSVWPLERVLLVDVGTAAAAIALLAFFLRVPSHGKAGQPATVSYFADMMLGFRYVHGHRYLVSFFAFVGTLLFLFAPAAFLTPLQVARTFGADVWRLTAIEIVFSVGMMVGGAIVAVWGGLRNRITTMAVTAGIMGICTILLGLTPDFRVYLVPMGLFGLVMPFFNTGAAVLLQEHIEPDYLGRVFSILTMLMTSTMPVGMLVFGPLAESVSIEWILVVTGALMILLPAFVLGNRTLREAGEPAGVRPRP